MEKTCEFCGAPGAVVYCQADAALLCLSCDAKVHSANALFGRHSRSLLCDSCKENSASVRCLDHLMLLCQGCDSRLHKSFSHHKKLMIGSFTGCPSVKQFADLWGFESFDVNDLRQFSTVESSTSTTSLDTGRASSSQQHKKLNNHQREQNNGLIMHQLLDLKNLQLTEGGNQTTSLRNNGEYVTNSSKHSTSGIMLDERLEQQSKELNNITNELQSLDRSNQMLNAEQFPSPMSQLDISSSVADPFWQHNKNPVDNDQFWSQNLQDLGMCQELGCIDDFNMPDVDVTFRNFEDLLTGDPDLTRALNEVDDPMSSGSEKASMNKLKNSLVETTQSSDHVTCGPSRSMENSLNPVKYSRAATFSCSRLSAESCRGDFRRIGSSNNVVELHGVEIEGGEHSIKLSKDKKRTRMHDMKTQLAPRKARSDLLKKNKSRYAKLQGYESDTATVTKSC